MTSAEKIAFSDMLLDMLPDEGLLAAEIACVLYASVCHGMNIKHSAAADTLRVAFDLIERGAAKEARR